jgi:hypothetical protein
MDKIKWTIHKIKGKFLIKQNGEAKLTESNALEKVLSAS